MVEIVRRNWNLQNVSLSLFTSSNVYNGIHPTIRLMIDDFIAYIAAERRYSPLTVRNYRHDVESFAAWCCDRAGIPKESFDPAAVHLDDVHDWIMHRIDDDRIKPASMNRELSSLKSYFRYLRMHGEVDRDVFKRISSLKTPHRLPAFVPETRMNKVLENLREQSRTDDFAEQRNALVVTLLYSCGIRLAELCGIRIDDFTYGYATLKVRGKGDKERVIPVLPEVARRIEEYIATGRSAGIIIDGMSKLILSDKGKPLSRSSIRRIVEKELSLADVQGRRSPHVLRHTFATHLLNRDADMRDIQELMGHASLKTTQNYTHNSIAKLQSVYAKAHPHK